MRKIPLKLAALWLIPVLVAAYLALQPPPARAVHGIIVDVTSSATIRDDGVTLLAGDGSRVTLED